MAAKRKADGGPGSLPRGPSGREAPLGPRALGVLNAEGLRDRGTRSVTGSGGEGWTPRRLHREQMQS